MAYGPQGIIPDYNYQQPQESGISKFGRHALGGGMAALQGGLGAYLMNNGMQQQQQQMQPTPSLPQAGPQQPKAMNIGPQFAVPEGQKNQLADYLQSLTSQKIDSMLASRQMPSQPNMLQNQAYQTANQQQGGQQAPQWNQQSPGFAFDQYTGGQQQFNPLSALADLGPMQQSEEEDQNAPWWKKAAHGFGGFLQQASPLAGMFGPLGALGGAAGSLAGYGLKQI